MLLSVLIANLFAPLSATAQLAGPGHFFFQWPTETRQCQLVNLTWANAQPPFQAWVIPINQQPFIYDIPDSAYSNGFGSYTIQLQLNQGTNYVMLMSDGRGMGSGGTSNTQIVSSSRVTECLNTASSNQTDKEFGFSVAGVARQCETGFELSWDGTGQNAPYNFTVVPLQQGYYPFDVPISESTGWTRDWTVNMTQGMRFTVVMNNRNGYGTGGAAGIYEVANTTAGGTSCIQQTMNPTASWPVGVATNTLPVATNSARPEEGSNGLGGGAIAGIVIGVLAALALIALLLFCFARRRRRRRQAEEQGKEHVDMDLADGVSERGDNGDAYANPAPAPAISPYPSGTVRGYSPVEQSDRGGWPGSGSGDGSGSGHGNGAGQGYVHGDGEGYGRISESDSRTNTSAGFAGFGAGTMRSSWNPSEQPSTPRMTFTDDGSDNRNGQSGVAGPLPSKSPRPSQHTSSAFGSQSPSRPSSGYTQTTKRDSALPPGAASAGAGFGAGSPLGLGGNGNGNGNNGGGRGMRVINHDHPDDLPAVDPSDVERDAAATRRREARMSEERERRMEFRRHADAGRVGVDYVDLPPLYTDVPRDGVGRGDSGGNGDGDGSAPGAAEVEMGGGRPVPGISPPGSGTPSPRPYGELGPLGR